MGKITDIQKQKRNKTLVSVYIDGEFVCGLDEITAASSRIKIGDEISADELKAVVCRSEINSAFERAVNYVSYAPRARREVERYLSEKGYDKDTISAAVAKLDEYRYIDDGAYARSYVKSRSAKYGSFRIKSELKRKGIADAVIDEAVREFEDESGDGIADSAAELARKYLRTHKTADRQKTKRFLAARGFAWDDISTVMKKLERDGVFDGDDECDDAWE